VNFDDNILELFVITYDIDSDKIYTFVDFDKALASIESSIRGYIGDECPQSDWMIDKIITAIRNNRHQKIIPLQFNDLQIVLQIIELDHQNRIVKALKKAYNQVDDNVKADIELLFSPVEV
jgi:hypothetical protein